jgi:hypothetical protein
MKKIKAKNRKKAFKSPAVKRQQFFYQNFVNNGESRRIFGRC